MKKLGSQRHFTGKNPISGSVDHREEAGESLLRTSARGRPVCQEHTPQVMSASAYVSVTRSLSSYGRVQKSSRVRCVFNQGPLAVYGNEQD